MASETAVHNANGAVDANPNTNAGFESKDPFAAQRESGEDPFENDKLGEIAGPEEMGIAGSSPPGDRRMSREWDASKVPPSQFQKRKGSIYSTPNSRDGHVKGSSRDKAYHDKIKEKGWHK